MGAEFFVDAMVVPFAKEVNVKVGEFGGAEGVGVINHPLMVPLFESQLVVDGEGVGLFFFVNRAIEFTFKEVGVMDGLHGVGLPFF